MDEATFETYTGWHRTLTAFGDAAYALSKILDSGFELPEEAETRIHAARVHIEAAERIASGTKPPVRA